MAAFRTVLFGCRKAAVQRLLASLEAERQQELRGLEERLQSLRAEGERLEARVREARWQARAAQQRGQHLLQTLLSQQAEGERPIEEARAEAEEARRQMAAQLASKRDELALARERVASFRNELASLIERYAATPRIGSGARATKPTAAPPRRSGVASNE